MSYELIMNQDTCKRWIYISHRTTKKQLRKLRKKHMLETKRLRKHMKYNKCLLNVSEEIIHKIGQPFILSRDWQDNVGKILVGV